MTRTPRTIQKRAGPAPWACATPVEPLTWTPTAIQAGAGQARLAGATPVKPATRTPTAIQKRAANPDFAATFSYPALAERLPLSPEVAADVAPSPKLKYLSHYQYLGHAELADPAVLATLSDFEIALRMVDFSPLRDLVASQVFHASRRGQVAYDPVSMLLCLLLRLEQDLSWIKLARLLTGPRGQEWRRLFGFEAGRTPSASGLRYFSEAIDPDLVESLCGRFVRSLCQAGLAPRQSTFPGDDPSRGVTICRDGQLHTARDKPRDCTCTPPAQATAPGTDPLPAADQTTRTPCQGICKQANPRDHQARFIRYSGKNKHADSTGKDEGGKTVFGYRSTADRLIDDRFATAWTVRSTVYAANTDEHTVFPDEFKVLVSALRPVSIGEILADAGLGYGPALELLYNNRILRMIDIRAHQTDTDPDVQRERGYNANGRPSCLHGFEMSANGYDAGRRRTKYICAHRCLSQTELPVPDCPFLTAGACGQVVNIGLTMPDGSRRLAREIPYGSAHWKARYGRRNIAESRNSQIEALGLLRLPCHGLRRARVHIAAADLLINLRNLGRLLREATALTP